MTSRNSSMVFARAMPTKISLKETYHYKAIVGYTSELKFQSAEGEINIEFLFDGRHNGSFGKNARQDVRAQDPDNVRSQALVGHLAIVEAGKTSWKDYQYEGKTIPVTVDIKDLPKKLESSLKYPIKYTYRINEPESAPVRLGDVYIRDQEKPQNHAKMSQVVGFESYPKFYIQLMAILPDKLLDTMRLSSEKLDNLLEMKSSVNVEFLAGSAKAETIYRSLLTLAQTNQGGYLFIGVEPDGNISGLTDEEADDLPEQIIQAVLLNPDAPPIPINKPDIRSSKTPEGDKKLGIVIVPSGLKAKIQSRDRPADFEKDYSIDAGSIKELVLRGRSRDTAFVSKNIGTNQLAKIFVALANAQGGYVLVGIQEKQENQAAVISGVGPEEINDVLSKVKLAFKKINPPLENWCKRNDLSLKRESDGQIVPVLAFYIASELSDVYSINGACWRRQAKQDQENSEVIDFEDRELMPDEIYELFLQKYGDYIHEALVSQAPPALNLGYVHWPYSEYHNPSLNGRGSKNGPVGHFPSRYDPARGALEWHQIEFGREKGLSAYQTELNWFIENPEELWSSNGSQPSRARDLEGHFELSLPSILLSGFNIKYFNGLGEMPSQSRTERIISKQTLINLDVEFKVSDLFSMRQTILYRHLEFDGVRPEWERCQDVREALNDLGFRIEAGEDDAYQYSDDIPRILTINATRRSEIGEAKIYIQFVNRWYSVERKVQYGQRIDTVIVPSGRIALNINGWVDGAGSGELVELLNRLQSMLKERFEFIKVS